MRESIVLSKAPAFLDKTGLKTISTSPQDKQIESDHTKNNSRY